MTRLISLFLFGFLCVSAVGQTVEGPREVGHPLTITFSGPEASETSNPNPFRDMRFDVVFENDGHALRVPGYFAADGNAGETGAESGDVWRVHFVPPDTGRWTFRAEVTAGPNAALTGEGEAGPGHGESGRIYVDALRLHRGGFLGRGILRHHPGERYLRFEDGTYFLKGGADSPENFLAYAGFDGTYSLKPEGTEQEGEANTAPLHRYEAHLKDWKSGDPTWRGGKGKSIIGALNYLASEGMNSVYFLTMNVEGDGDDVWPWTDAVVRDRFDVSKLDQWSVVFDHMDRLGLMMHVILTETENEVLFERYVASPTDFADERKLYYRELVARFAHHPALVWNLGEENGWDDRDKPSTGNSGAATTDEQRRQFASYIRDLDPYDHPIVVHTLPGDQERIYRPLLSSSTLDGVSLQIGNMTEAHEETLKWVTESAASGRSWFVHVDEIGPAEKGVSPDGPENNHDDVRRHVLWGNLMAGGAGVEWYFGYTYPHNDLNAEDWRSRDRMWDYTRHALAFFREHLPFWEMAPDDALSWAGGDFVLAKPGETYAVYLSSPKATRVNLAPGTYSVKWYNPRDGGSLQDGTVTRVVGPGWQDVGTPEGAGDWVALIRRAER